MALSTKDFIPVSMKMKAANNKGIRILGAVVIRFAGNTSWHSEFGDAPNRVRDGHLGLHIPLLCSLRGLGHDLRQVPNTRGGLPGDI